jgi:hypothetical protein
MKMSLLAISASLVLVGVVWADSPSVGCATDEQGVGCLPDSCAKVCMPQLTIKKKEKTVYGCKCVDFCVPKPSRPQHHGHDTCGCGKADCNACASQCGACQACSGAGCIKCGCVRTKKVLIKKVQTTEHCAAECVPQTLCGEHGNRCAAGQ